MLYRNRAGEYLNLHNGPAAQADIDKAAELEPEAPRLAQLRQQWQAWQEGANQ